MTGEVTLTCIHTCELSKYVNDFLYRRPIIVGDILPVISSRRHLPEYNERESTCSGGVYLSRVIGPAGPLYTCIVSIIDVAWQPRLTCAPITNVIIQSINYSTPEHAGMSDKRSRKTNTK